MAISPTVFALVIIAWLTMCSAPPITKEDLEADLDLFVPQMMSCRDLVGVSVSVVRGNQTLFRKGYGFADLATNTTVNQNTLFGIASLTKAFTQSLLGKVLNITGKNYTWDTKIRDILGLDFYFHDSLRTMNATLRDLLSHRMGIPSHNSMRHQSGLNRETLARKIRFLRPNTDFRSEYFYHNQMYGLLAYVTEAIAGDTWENLVRTYIFEPLNMTSSDFTHEIDIDRPDVARSYEFDVDGSLREVSPSYHSYWGKIGGSGSILSNAADMAKWLNMLLRDGRDSDGSVVIPSDVIKESRTAHSTIQPSAYDYDYLRPTAPVSFTHFSYGLGWRTGFYRDWPTIHHTGTSMGYLSQITLIPDQQIGVVTSMTGEDPGYTCRRHLSLHVLDLLLGESPWINLNNTCSLGNSPTSHVKTSNAIASLTNLTVYEGTYGNFAYGNVSFYVENTTLMMAYGDYGIWQMKSTSVEHGFDATGTGVVWQWGFWDIIFGYEQVGGSGPMDFVTINSMEPEDPPTFVRGREFDDAPAPPPLTCPT